MKRKDNKKEKNSAAAAEQSENEAAENTEKIYESNDSESGETDRLSLFPEMTDNIKVVKNEPDKKDIKNSVRKRRKTEKKNKYPNRIAFLLGLVILMFAVIGIVLIAVNCIQYINSTRDTQSEFDVYNAYLTPVAAVDPDTFDDITSADMQQLLDISIWSILSADSTPDTYVYQYGEMLIPAADVKAAYAAIFGPETSGKLVHMTVQSYNCTFTYDSVSDVYRIPITTITPIYTPKVISSEKSGDSLILTVNYIATESWDINENGNYAAPSPDKVMKITLRELQGNYYIGAIQAVSSTTPETIYFESTTITQVTAPQVPETAPEETVTETTTSKYTEKTTLGGRV